MELSEDALQRIERNRRLALAKKKKAKLLQAAASGTASTSNPPPAASTITLPPFKPTTLGTTSPAQNVNTTAKNPGFDVPGAPAVRGTAVVAATRPLEKPMPKNPHEQRANLADQLHKKKYTVTAHFELLTRERFTVKVMSLGQVLQVFQKFPGHRKVAALKATGMVTIEGLPNCVLGTFLRSIPDPATGQSRHVLVDTMRERCNVNLAMAGIDPKLVQSLKDFQKEGVRIAIERGGRILIADDMGLGKTLQAICVACYYRAEWPLLVVTPASMRGTWVEAFLQWCPSLPPRDINEVVGSRASLEGKVVVMTYDSVSTYADDLKRRPFRIIIADESHLIKNFKTARSQTMLPLLQGASHAILLSGTPALSRPGELFTQIQAIDNNLFPSFIEYGKRYCDGKSTNYGFQANGATHCTELYLLLSERIMIRRMKSEVMSQLPAKRRQQVLIACKPKDLRGLQELQKGKPIQLPDDMTAFEKPTGALLQLYRMTGGVKIPGVQDYVCDLLERDIKFLVFAHHQDVLDAVEAVVRKKKTQYIRIDGNTSPTARQQLADEFQTRDCCRVAVLSILAANSGITLTAASTVVFAELTWNPGTRTDGAIWQVLLQAEDRVHRIGQESLVNIHYLLAKDTVDVLIWKKLEKKLSVLGNVGLNNQDLQKNDVEGTDDLQLALQGGVNDDDVFDGMDADPMDDVFANEQEHDLDALFADGSEATAMPFRPPAFTNVSQYNAQGSGGVFGGVGARNDAGALIGPQGGTKNVFGAGSGSGTGNLISKPTLWATIGGGAGVKRPAGEQFGLVQWVKRQALQETTPHAQYARQ